MPQRSDKSKRKPKGRQRSGMPASEAAQQKSHNLKIIGDNGESYQIDFLKMCQYSIRTGTRRALIRRGGKWFFDDGSLRASSVELQKRVAERFPIDRIEESGPNAEYTEKVAHVTKYKGQTVKWCAYASKVQSVLEFAFQKNCAGSCLAENVEENLTCTLGHPMHRSANWKHHCSLCDSQGTVYQCAQGCDYDICARCSQHAPAQGLTNAPDMYKFAGQTIPSDQCPEDVRAIFESVLTSGITCSGAFRTLQALVRDHGFECSVDDVRRIVLSTSSPEMLQVVICNAPQVQLLGMEIFDRRYPRLVLNEHLKLCVKILLARGAQLGKRFAPPSKLLRKLEADTNDAWADRYLISMTRAGMDLPDNVQKRIFGYLHRDD